MESTFTIKTAKDHPNITLDKNLNLFELSGRSVLMSPADFAVPVFKWIDEYIEDPNPVTEVNVRFDYLNSASIRFMVEFLTKLENLIQKGKMVKVLWHYKDEDEIMKERGEEIQSAVNVPFEFKMAN